MSSLALTLAPPQERAPARLACRSSLRVPRGSLSSRPARPPAATCGGFLAASSLVGLLARRGWDRDIRSAISAMFLGEVVVYAAGVPWLMGALHVPLEKGLELGLYPFVVGDALKLLFAATLLPGAWRLMGSRGD